MNIFEGVIKIKSLLRYPGSKKQEVLWMNFEPPEQLSIFDLVTDEDKAR